MITNGGGMRGTADGGLISERVLIYIATTLIAVLLPGCGGSEDIPPVATSLAAEAPQNLQHPADAVPLITDDVASLKSLKEQFWPGQGCDSLGYPQRLVDQAKKIPYENQFGLGCIWASTMANTNNSGTRLTQGKTYDSPNQTKPPNTILVSTLSSIATTRPTVDDWINYEPVLFVPGYLADALGADCALSGGKGTWGNFPELTRQLLTGLDITGNYIPFEFEWCTDATFKTVAGDLRRAVDQIYRETNKKVHLIGHSFGGILVRTMLTEMPDSPVASVLTLGTPHSGIAYNRLAANQIECKKGAVPEGMPVGAAPDPLGLLVKACRQVSCFEAGAAIYDSLSDDQKKLESKRENGWLIKELAEKSSNLPPIGFLIGIGVTKSTFGNYEDGDELISFAGQRWKPSSTKTSVEGRCVSNSYEVSDDLYHEWTPVGVGASAKFKELVLGVMPDCVPGSSECWWKRVKPGASAGDEVSLDPLRSMGYAHSVTRLDGIGNFGREAYISAEAYCGNVANCGHEALAYLRMVAQVPIQSQLPDTGVLKSHCFRAGSESLVGCSSDGAVALSGPMKQDGMNIRARRFREVPSAPGNFHPRTDCVFDSETQLMWEGKPRDFFNFRDSENTYSYSPDVDQYVRDVNSSELCGFRDWRMPKDAELATLIDYGKADAPRIDLLWFPNTEGVYWAGEEFDYFGATSVNFTTTNVGISSKFVDRLKIRLVRGFPARPFSRYALSMDGAEVNDLATGLTWKRCPAGQSWVAAACHGDQLLMTHEEALVYAKNQGVWRMPTIREFLLSTDRRSGFLGGHYRLGYGIWSSTPLVGFPGAQLFTFWHGAGGTERTRRQEVVLVRASP